MEIEEKKEEKSVSTFRVAALVRSKLFRGALAFLALSFFYIGLFATKRPVYNYLEVGGIAGIIAGVIC
jgi:hypothetical protein